ncbi:hypothetical protein [Anditalea andensis]|uniref:Uncharacterized protein n=1 Tax=Anditalea andensis TaxID=1048983 RepID=A0A074KSY7_9BACT|nr:hypothetical protein [Anditalea andensis]KEO73071.1 hypothetical protein EL17_15800 [Anditalea andensis]
MAYFNFKRRNLISGPHLIGPLIIAAGILVLLSPLFIFDKRSVVEAISVGVGAIFLGMIIISVYCGTLIDFPNKRYKNYVSIGYFRYGEWICLPDLNNITVVSVNYIRHNTPNGISPTLSGQVTDYRILIFSNDSEPVLSFIYSDIVEAVRDAEYIASHLKVNLVYHLSN